MIRELLPPQTGLAFAAMGALRTDLADEESFVGRVDGTLRGQGYRLAGAFEAGAEGAVGVAGFRIADSLAWGRYLYVDDLSTLPEARRRGHGRALLDWLLEEARRESCEQLHLDSGVELNRADAHRLYLNAGLVITAHHFARYVK
ncbi:MAG TPA: GNAT family N-acetyltransferase [Solirubrobacterales bacterium]|nr:GNAT family N-acetyltransferase [Solirubrobacterales bacterium]